MPGTLSIEELDALAERGAVKTVICGMPDIWGRLVGKRLTVEAFRRCAVGSEGLHASSYLFCVDMDMDPRPGYALTDWDRGFHDCVMAPDLDTIRLLPWVPETAFVLCDPADHDHQPLPIGPRTIAARS